MVPSNSTNLRVCWPVAEFLETLTHLFVLQNIKVLKFDAVLVKELHNRPVRESERLVRG